MSLNCVPQNGEFYVMCILLPPKKIAYMVKGCKVYSEEPSARFLLRAPRVAQRRAATSGFLPWARRGWLASVYQALKSPERQAKEMSPVPKAVEGLQASR